MNETPWHEPLGGLDATFLQLEDRTAHMHVGSVAVFRGRPPAYDEFVAHVNSRLPRVPRYRQRLAFVPLSLGRPSWIDDDAFDIEYHVRHVALPHPGDDAALATLAARLFSQRLDRDKPLWELTLVEGLADDRFAIISKTHHCMIDGVSGVDLATVLLDPHKNAPDLVDAPLWCPRPAPGARSLAVAALRDQVAAPIEAPFAIARSLWAKRNGGSVDQSVDDGAFGRAKETAKLLLGGLKPLLSIAAAGRAPVSSINVPLSAHRRWETLAFDLGAVKQVRASLGGTVNDVVLAVVAGAMRTFLMARNESVVEDLRVMVPVSVRPQQDRGKLGNQVAAIFCDLPVHEASAAERLRIVSKTMTGLKQTKQAVGALALTKLSDFAPPTLAAQAARLSVANPWFNLVVTNVPGPQQPIYLRGRELLHCHPLVPLAARQTIGIALLSYNGHIDVGLLGDADRTRDLPVLKQALLD
ncbi:MAG TPA: wax ester/triacylglycerol synthase family O-acyltransferase, partial [Myxococcota bacterium]